MLYIASDHAGFKLKEYLKSYFNKKKIEYKDLGPFSEDRVDYSLYAKKLALNVKKAKSKGILICGTGTGMVIGANRIKGIRAVLAYDIYSAKMSREHNDANILCLRGREVNFKKQISIVNTWLNTKFSNILRHKKRIKQLDK